MVQNNFITECAFSKYETSLVDSFVLPKLGEGHGESTLYLGGKAKQKEISELFQNSESSNVHIFFSKKNFLSIMNFYEPYFKKPHGFYLDNGKLINFKDDLESIYKNGINEITANKELFYEEVELLKADSQGRIYLRFNKNSIMRRVFLPHSVKCIFSIYTKEANSIFCQVKAELSSVKKKIKINKEMITVDIDYFNSYE